MVLALTKIRHSKNGQVMIQGRYHHYHLFPLKPPFLIEFLWLGRFINIVVDSSESKSFDRRHLLPMISKQTRKGFGQTQYGDCEYFSTAVPQIKCTQTGIPENSTIMRRRASETKR